MQGNRSLKWLLAAAGVLAAATLSWEIYDFVGIDSCLDRGGSWHSDRAYCDHRASYAGSAR